MPALRALTFLLLLIPALAGLHAEGWEEVKIGPQPYVTLESFCAFYGFDPVKEIPEKEPFDLKGPYGTLTLNANSRDARYNGRRVWLSFGFVRNAEGKGFVSKLDVIKLFDPLLRRDEMAPRRKLGGVVIDAGHGGADNGARSKAGILEKNVALDTAKRLKVLLDAAGIPNVMTRDQDEFILLEERASKANRYPGWIFVSMHYNSGPSHAHGVETYSLTPQYSSSSGDSGRPTVKDRIAEPGNAQDALNLILADFVHQEISKMHSKEGDRGLKRARFVVLRNVKIPGVLIEAGFLSNAVDSRLISTGSYRQKVAQATANAILNYKKLVESPPARAPLTIEPAGPKPDPAPPKPKEKETAPAPAPAEVPKPAEVKPDEPTPPPSPPKEEAPVSKTEPELLLSKPVIMPRPEESGETEKPVEEEEKEKPLEEPK